MSLEQASQEVVAEKMEDPVWAKVLTETVGKFNSHFWPQDYIDIIFQKGWGRPDIYDAYHFACIHAAIMDGRIAVFQIPVDCVPFGDKEIDENGIFKNDLVLQELKEPFGGKFWGGNYDNDGYIGWTKPINALLCIREMAGFVIVPPFGEKNDSGQFVKCCPCPLEVGTTNAGTTHFHLRYVFAGTGEWAVARWPYGQNRITILVSATLCYSANSEGFQDMRSKVYGDFHTLPNPWDNWSW